MIFYLLNPKKFFEISIFELELMINSASVKDAEAIQEVIFNK